MHRLARVLLATAMALTAGIAWKTYAGETQLAHAIYVKVNGETITQDQVKQVQNYIITQEYNGVMPRDEEELEKIHEASIRDLVRALLIRSEARKVGVTISSSRTKRLILQAGLKPDDVTPTIRRLLEADDLFEDLMAMSGTPIRDPSPREIKDFYTENRDQFRSGSYIIIRTIFLPVDDRRPQSFYKAQAEELMEQLRAVPQNRRTAAFAEAAKKYSQDVFAEVGGLLNADSPEPWIPKDFPFTNADGTPIFPPTMVEEIRRLNRPGEVRLAVSDDGMHILYCENVQGGKTVKWDEARNIIEYVLKTRYRNTRLRAWLNQIYDRSDVRWHDGTEYEKDNLTMILLPSERGPLNE